MRRDAGGIPVMYDYKNQLHVFFARYDALDSVNEQTVTKLGLYFPRGSFDTREAKEIVSLCQRIECGITECAINIPVASSTAMKRFHRYYSHRYRVLLLSKIGD